MARHYDPLAPLAPRAQRRQARRYVRGQILPLLAQLNREFASRSRGATGYTEELARQLGGMRRATHDIYAGAEGQQQSVDTALANRLAGLGGSVSEDIGAKLRQAGIAPTEDLGQVGRGAAAAQSGIGSSALASLIARGAAAENYSGSLPGIARLGGQHMLRQLEGERSLAADKLRSQIPGMVERILQNQQATEFQKAAARLSYQGDLASIGTRAAVSRRGQNLSYQARMAAIAAANARTGMTLAERARQNGLTRNQQAKRDAEAARHHRAQERTARYRAHHSGKGKGRGGPPSLR